MLSKVSRFIAAFFYFQIWISKRWKNKQLSWFHRPCLRAPAEFTPQSSLVKICPVKPLSTEKIFNLPDAYYIIQFTPLELLSNWFSQVIFWTTLRWVLILPKWHNSDRPWCLLGSHRDHSSPRWLFSRNIVLNFLVMIDWLPFTFTNFLWWDGNRH